MDSLDRYIVSEVPRIGRVDTQHVSPEELVVSSKNMLEKACGGIGPRFKLVLIALRCVLGLEIFGHLMDRFVGGDLVPYYELCQRQMVR